MSTFEKKTMPSGEENPKYVDLCDEDSAIAGQKFACMSFVSPEKILKKREVYLFDQFVKQWEFSKSMERYFEFIHFISYKHNLKVETLIEDFNEFVRRSKPNQAAARPLFSDFCKRSQDSWRIWNTRRGRDKEQEAKRGRPQSRYFCRTCWYLGAVGP